MNVVDLHLLMKHFLRKNIYMFQNYYNCKLSNKYYFSKQSCKIITEKYLFGICKAMNFYENTTTPNYQQHDLDSSSHD